MAAVLSLLRAAIIERICIMLMLFILQKKKKILCQAFIVLRCETKQKLETVGTFSFIIT